MLKPPRTGIAEVLGRARPVVLAVVCGAAVLVSPVAGDGPTDTAYDAGVMADSPLVYWHELSGGLDGLRSQPIDVGPDLTIEAWVKADTSAATGILVSLYDGQAARALYLDGQRFVGMADLSADWPTYSVISTNVDPLVWHHVVFSIQGGATLRLYVDGASVGTAIVAPRPDLTATATLGASDASWMARFSGSLTRVAVYGSALSAQRVNAHFVAAAARSCSIPLQALIDAADPGSTVSVPACVYREKVRIDRPLTLAGEPGAEIRGSDVWTDWTPSGSMWVSQKSVPPLPAFPNTDGRCGETTNRCSLPQQVFVDGRALFPVASGVVPISGQFALDANRHVVLASDPGNHTIEVTTRTRWIVTASDGVTISGFTMRHAANDAQVGAVSNDGYSDWTIRDSVLSDAHGGVISINKGARLNILRNDISRGGDLGVDGTLVTTGLIQGNHIHNNNTDQFSPVWGAGAVKITLASGLVLDANEIDNNSGVGLWCDIQCQNVTFSANRVHDNQHQGIQFEISDGASIHHNVVWHNGWGTDNVWGAGILVSSSSNADVYANTLAWNTAGIAVVEQSRDNKIDARNIRVHDNTVVGVDGTVSLAWRSDPSQQQLFDPSAGNGGAGNRYWFPTPDGASTRFVWGAGRSSLADFLKTPGDLGANYLSADEKNQILQANGIPTDPPA